MIALQLKHKIAEIGVHGWLLRSALTPLLVNSPMLITLLDIVFCSKVDQIGHTFVAYGTCMCFSTICLHVPKATVTLAMQFWAFLHPVFRNTYTQRTIICTYLFQEMKRRVTILAWKRMVPAYFITLYKHKLIDALERKG
jgi:hypothetical protein